MAVFVLKTVLYQPVQAFLPAGRTESRFRKPFPARRLANALGRRLQRLVGFLNSKFTNIQETGSEAMLQSLFSYVLFFFNPKEQAQQTA